VERSLNEPIVIKSMTDDSDETAVNESELSSPMNSLEPSLMKDGFEAVKMVSLLKIPDLLSVADLSTGFCLRERMIAAESCWFLAQVSPKLFAALYFGFSDRCIPDLIDAS
jgi:hypothetical protein